MIVDHKNFNGLDNRRENIRNCTYSENSQHIRMQQNRSKSSHFKGVCWHKSHNRWLAYVSVDRRQLHLGHFLSEIEAALAYNKAALKYHGEFAKLNIVEVKLAKSGT